MKHILKNCHYNPPSSCNLHNVLLCHQPQKRFATTKSSQHGKGGQCTHSMQVHPSSIYHLTATKRKSPLFSLSLAMPSPSFVRLPVTAFILNSLSGKWSPRLVSDLPVFIITHRLFHIIFSPIQWRMSERTAVWVSGQATTAALPWRGCCEYRRGHPSESPSMHISQQVQTRALKRWRITSAVWSLSRKQFPG